MAPSKKTAVIEWVFNNKYDAASGELSDEVVTFDQLEEAIVAAGNGLKTTNPANFWKDITRHDPNRSWPSSVFEKGYTGSDAIGVADRACFKFVKAPAGQVTPFVNQLAFDRERVATHVVQSLSMPLAMKALGRSGENWIAQVAAQLGVIETFLAVFSPREALEVSFLQTGVKMRNGEVDAAFSVTDEVGQWLIAAEAKGRSENLHEAQIARAAHQLNEDVRNRAGSLEHVLGVIPFAMKVVGRSEIWVVEFAPVESADSALTIVAEGIVKLEPAVAGIG
ncbi:hypothetical protein [Homoserinimonas hongtaonis]|uniref:Restriction endonuclease n=1 Tax=Homoserinimonas hongtaonis TaxID=2079791 RepID=A0A2U1SZT6_9MICO|nr:hypothetical protein [Salinibacterium hongtaonis]PWB97131.1 hypothetical protein DF220_04220 [Salinibacterium hongtaonis]